VIHGSRCNDIRAQHALARDSGNRRYAQRHHGRFLMEIRNNQISLVRVDAIKVTNPRTRGKKSFRDIVDSIESVGLKRH
jgi:hypothetical protein